MNNSIISNYESFYCNKDHSKVYPTEFVVRTFLADYPQLKFKKPDPKSRILDIGSRDGRPTMACHMSTWFTFKSEFG